jgi:hypothetical protein
MKHVNFWHPDGFLYLVLVRGLLQFGVIGAGIFTIICATTVNLNVLAIPWWQEVTVRFPLIGIVWGFAVWIVGRIRKE